MAEHTTNAYKNDKRRHSRTLIREGMFISDYVNTKYKCIYEEAAVLYNEINRINPRKPDLRRTKEYRHWKNNFASAHNMPITTIPREKKRQLVHTTHRDVPISTTSHSTIVCVDLPVIENPTTDNQILPESPRTEIPLADDQSSPQSPEKPIQDNRISGMTMQLNIPLMPCLNITKTVQAPKEIPGTDYRETVIDEGNQAETFNPSLIDEISPEVIEKIISDLQKDPGLKDMMTDIESQFNIEEEILGLDIDVDDLHNPLEEELLNMYW